MAPGKKKAAPKPVAARKAAKGNGTAKPIAAKAAAEIEGKAAAVTVETKPKELVLAPEKSREIAEKILSAYDKFEEQGSQAFAGEVTVVGKQLAALNDKMPAGFDAWIKEHLFRIDRNKCYLLMRTYRIFGPRLEAPECKQILTEIGQERTFALVRTDSVHEPERIIEIAQEGYTVEVDGKQQTVRLQEATVKEAKAWERSVKPPKEKKVDKGANLAKQFLKATKKVDEMARAIILACNNPEFDNDAQVKHVVKRLEVCEAVMNRVHKVVAALGQEVRTLSSVRRPAAPAAKPAPRPVEVEAEQSAEGDEATA